MKNSWKKDATDTRKARYLIKRECTDTIVRSFSKPYTWWLFLDGNLVAGYRTLSDAKKHYKKQLLKVYSAKW